MRIPVLACLSLGNLLLKTNELYLHTSYKDAHKYNLIERPDRICNEGRSVSMSMYMYIQIHTHTCIHTCVHTYKLHTLILMGAVFQWRLLLSRLTRLHAVVRKLTRTEDTVERGLFMNRNPSHIPYANVLTHTFLFLLEMGLD